MMKKTYIAPEAKAFSIQPTTILAGSDPIIIINDEGTDAPALIKDNLFGGFDDEDDLSFDIE